MTAKSAFDHPSKIAIDPKQVQNPKSLPREWPKLLFCLLSQEPFDFMKILLVTDLALILIN